MGTNSTFPRDITRAVTQLFDGLNGPRLVNATVEAKRLLRVFLHCGLNVAQLVDMIARESVNHSGSGVMVGRDG
jgi:hypothetical protein